MNPLKSQILAAAHADCIPKGESGLWHIKKLRLKEPLPVEWPKTRTHAFTLPPGTWTSLFRFTDATMHHSLGELVMHDYPVEIARHLIFMLRAKGNVLITGLGLGCVVRGALANPAVQKVTVLEESSDVLRLVQPHMEQSARLEIIHTEAEAWIGAHPMATFDCAWHDLWVDESNEKNESLQLKHSALISRLVGRVKFQGAWEFPRSQRRLWAAHGLGVI